MYVLISWKYALLLVNEIFIVVFKTKSKNSLLSGVHIDRIGNVDRAEHYWRVGVSLTTSEHW